jgi:hypothetical protein
VLCYFIKRRPVIQLIVLAARLPKLSLNADDRVKQLRERCSIVCDAALAAARSLLASLRHPNILMFLGYARLDPDMALVTEYMPRRSLDRLLHRSDVPLDLVRRLRMAVRQRTLSANLGGGGKMQ